MRPLLFPRFSEIGGRTLTEHSYMLIQFGYEKNALKLLLWTYVNRSHYISIHSSEWDIRIELFGENTQSQKMILPSSSLFFRLNCNEPMTKFMKQFVEGLVSFSCRQWSQTLYALDVKFNAITVFR